MSNEEKILQMLEHMNGRLDTIESGQAMMREETRKIVYEEVRDQMEPLRNTLTELEQLPKQIQLLVEAHQLTNEKLDNLQKTVDDMAPTVTALDVLHQMRPHNT